ncbi:ABI gene family member 3 isoform X9 [Papio anubis]|uniref:ABI gene family member 3 isoform X9 n=1 Tax=Papio anubis TaxID=9555 RepID=UPI000B7B4000|nr:ABI gene family member 3 isoform X9 [Papio anubis]
MAELQQLQEFEIPTGREALRGNHSALLRVADYCEDNYVQATDKRKALEETMAFTTQALASVAYQVGNLAGHTLRMLDLQGAALRQVEARVSTLGQMVNMHMEKVARREIGTLATVQRLPPGQKVIAPESLPPLTPYYRRPLNFGCLDDIGHGIKPYLPLPRRISARSCQGQAPCLERASRPLPHPPPPHWGDHPGFPSQCTSRWYPTADSPPPPPPLPWPRQDEELPLPLDLPPPPPLDGDELGLPPPPPGFGPDEPSWVPASYLEKVVTLYPYIGQKDNELSFSEGTVICVTRRYSDGWCEGISSEGTGFFPGNYVEPSC